VLHCPAPEGPASEVLPLEEVLGLRLGLVLLLELLQLQLVPQLLAGVLVKGLVLLLQAQLVLRPDSRGQLVRMLLDRRPNTVC